MNISKMNVELNTRPNENIETGAVKTFAKNNLKALGERTPLTDRSQCFLKTNISTDADENTPRKNSFKRLNEKKHSIQVYKDKKDVGIQVSEPDEPTIEDLMSENPSRAYWKKLCESRLKSLEEAQEENDRLQREVRLMRAVVESCQEFMLKLGLHVGDEDESSTTNSLLESIKEVKTISKTDDSLAGHSSSMLSEAYFSEDETQ